MHGGDARTTIVALLLAMVVSSARAVRWPSSTPYTSRWLQAPSKGMSCSKACATQTDEGNVMCQNERAKALTSVAIINGAGVAATAASAFTGLALGWTCTGLVQAYAPPMMEKNGNGKCWTASSGTTCDKSHGAGFALCCCTAPGESPAAMCPVSAADCADGGLFWDATTFQCVGDAGLPLCQHGEESPLCSLNEPLNSTNQVCPVGTWLPEDTAALLSASTWPCKRCAAGKRGVLPGMTSEAEGCKNCTAGKFSAAPGGAVQCIDCPPLRWSRAGSNHTSQCEAIAGWTLAAKSAKCTDTCAAQMRGGATASCQVDRMRAVNSKTRMTFVISLMGGTCTKVDGPNSEKERPMISSFPSGLCYPGNGGTTCDQQRNDHFRLCCCSTPSELPSAVCPTSLDSSACSGNNSSFWWAGVNTCAACPLHSTWPNMDVFLRFGTPTECKCDPGYFMDASASKCLSCSAAKYGTVSGATSEAEACIDGGCTAGRYGKGRGGLTSNASVTCAQCPAWGRATTPPGQTYCVGSPTSGWIAANFMGESCDEVCMLSVRREAKCRPSPILNVATLRTFRAANGAAANGASLSCASYGDARIATASGKSTNTALVGEKSGLCVYNALLSKFGTCGKKDPSVRRLCCCTTDAEHATDGSVSMCATSAAQCSNRTAWNGEFCDACKDGTARSSNETDAVCAPCEAGRFSTNVNAAGPSCAPCTGGKLSRTGSSSCDFCKAGRARSRETGAEFTCDKCLAGRFAAFAGQTTCSNCSEGRFAQASGLTSNAQCQLCMFGRYSSDVGRTSQCVDLIGAACPALNETSSISNTTTATPTTGSLSPNVRIASWVSLLNHTAPGGRASPKFGDLVQLICKDGTRPQFGPNVVSCATNGKWMPDPRASALNPTQCNALYCKDVELPAASHALIVQSPILVNNGKEVFNLIAKQAPSTVKVRCHASARMIVNGSVQDFGSFVEAKCTPSNLIWFETKQESGNDETLDFSTLKCQCGKGFKQGTGALIAKCIACLDGTYAPLSVAKERAECRACPREGVSCNDGILKILEDKWYDTIAAARADAEGKIGIGPTTKIYSCAMRDACLLDKKAVPMTVRCHENHTGVMCARCYSRRVDCGRPDANGAILPGCEPPGFFDRSKEWMFFAPIARHCMRCPAGDDAVYSYVTTAVLAVAFGVALVLVVVNRLMSAWKRTQGKSRSDASGIARVFFNWIQMVSMLQAIKLQPPEEVTNAMETAEVANVSIEWFPVQCTLRLSFFSRVLIYMCLPLFAVLVPVCYVHVVNKCTPQLRKHLANKRRAKRIGRNISKAGKLFYSCVSLLAGDDLGKKASTKSSTRNTQHLRNEIDVLKNEIDWLIDDLTSAETELTQLKAAHAVQDAGEHEVEETEHEESAAMVAAPPGCVTDAEDEQEEDATPLASAAEGGDNVLRFEEHSFFEVISAIAISLRSSPSCNAPKLPWVIQQGDVVAADAMEKHGGRTFIELSGPWGHGWVCGSASDGAACLKRIESETLVDPSADPVETHLRDEIQHCFQSIVAMSSASDALIAPDCIARASIEYVLPSAWTPAQQDAFFADYDGDGDGSIDFSEFVTMYPNLRKEWRFEHAWAEFQHIDRVSKQGKLHRDKLEMLVPPGSSQKELDDWMVRFDRGSKGYITLSDFVAIDSAVQRDTLVLSIGTAFVLCTYFVYSRVTKALLSVFSMDKIEGVLYLKLEMGTPALTGDHIAMMVLSAVYLLVFSAAVPLVGLFAMFYTKDERGERRFTTIAGFIMDGYREEVAWFWEFIVLGRKLIILGVSLFIWEPFMQSLVAMVILIFSLSIQLYFQPFELILLNFLEVASLSSLLATQLGGILMWYKSLPGQGEHLEWYRSGATILLFAANGFVIFAFSATTLYYFIKQKSKHIVQWLPCTLPLFDALVAIEETLRWPNGTPLLHSERLDIREEWTYFSAQRGGRLFGRGASHKFHSKAKETALKLKTVASALGVHFAEEDEEDDDGDDSHRDAIEVPRSGAENQRLSTSTLNPTLNPAIGHLHPDRDLVTPAAVVEL